jgi:hypothetical protein
METSSIIIFHVESSNSYGEQNKVTSCDGHVDE